MVTQERGHASPPNGKGRAVLSVRSPIVEDILGGLTVDGVDLSPLRSFGKALVHARNAWDINRHRFGIFSRSRQRCADADAALKKALAEIGGAE